MKIILAFMLVLVAVTAYSTMGARDLDPWDPYGCVTATGNKTCTSPKATCCYMNETGVGDCIEDHLQCCGLNYVIANGATIVTPFDDCPRDHHSCTNTDSTKKPGCIVDPDPETYDRCEDTGKTLVCKPKYGDPGFMVSWRGARLINFNITFCRCLDEEVCKTVSPGLALDVIYSVDGQRMLPYHKEESFTSAADIKFPVIGSLTDNNFYVDIIVDGLDVYGVLKARYCIQNEDCTLSDQVIIQETIKIGVTEAEVEDVCDELPKELQCPTDNCIEGSLILFLFVFGGIAVAVGLVCVVKRHQATKAVEREKKEAGDADRKIAEKLGISKVLEEERKPTKSKLLEEEMEVASPKPVMIAKSNEPEAKIAEIEVRNTKPSPSPRFQSQGPSQSYSAPPAYTTNMAPNAPAYSTNMAPNAGFQTMPQNAAYGSMGMTGYDMMQQNMMMGGMQGGMQGGYNPAFGMNPMGGYPMQQGGYPMGGMMNNDMAMQQQNMMMMNNQMADPMGMNMGMGMNPMMMDPMQQNMMMPQMDPNMQQQNMMMQQGQQQF